MVHPLNNLGIFANMIKSCCKKGYE